MRSGKSSLSRGSASQRGFTLIELLITVAILALLASGALTFADMAVRRSQEQELRGSLRQIREAIDAYKSAVDARRIKKAADETGYPPNLEVLTEGVVDAADPKGRKIFLLRRLPRDPMADTSLPAEQTWGLRSYDSDAASPQAGRDVFDVYSLSTKVGLGGRPYREW
jgi:general secretion pathway protein G